MRLCKLTVAFFLINTAMYAQHDTVRVKLAFIPRYEKTTVIPKELQNTGLQIENFVDQRDGQKFILGKSDHDEEYYIIRANRLTPIDAFTTNSFKKSFIACKGKIDSVSNFILNTELLGLSSIEGGLYTSVVVLRFTLKNKNGKILWSGTTRGDAKNWGRFKSEVNHNEVISDALQDAFMALFENEGFISAWSGREVSLANFIPSKNIKLSGNSSSDSLKTHLLNLFKEGFKDDMLISYVRQHSLSYVLTAKEIIEWKKEGIPQEVIKEVIEPKSKK